ncbi:hypothetical protein A2164_03875, partial [Candidatus Curtissbacteria bacterium RBG_13_35_7]
NLKKQGPLSCDSKLLFLQNLMTFNFKQKAGNLLQQNTHKSFYQAKKYRYTVPSNKVYPFQWFWDSCFHAISWSHIDTERAKEEIYSLLSHQGTDGFIPHVIFWNQKLVRRFFLDWNYLESKGRWFFLPFTKKPKTTSHIQPPLIAQAVEKIYQKTNDDKFLKLVLPSIIKYYHWLIENRDPDNDGLISIVAQFESGLDFNPAYDPNTIIFKHSPITFWPFSRLTEVKNKVFYNFNLKQIFKHTNHHQEDILVNSIFIQGLNSLSNIAQKYDKKAADWAKVQSQKSLQSLINKCYDSKSGLFWNLRGKSEQKFKIKTVISLMPIIIPDLPKDIVNKLVKHLENKNQFSAPYQIPTVSLDESSFKPDNKLIRSFIWRGSVSININWFIINGLRKHGYYKLSDKLTKQSKNLV